MILFKKNISRFLGGVIYYRNYTIMNVSVSTSEVLQTQYVECIWLLWPAQQCVTYSTRQSMQDNNNEVEPLIIAQQPEEGRIKSKQEIEGRCAICLNQFVIHFLSGEPPGLVCENWKKAPHPQEYNYYGGRNFLFVLRTDFLYSRHFHL